MIKLSAKIRKDTGKKVRKLRVSERIPAIVYGHKIKNVLLDLDYVEFAKVFGQAGESSLIELSVEGMPEKKLVLVHEAQRDAITDKFIHVDFFETSAKEEVEADIPLVFEGVALAVKDLGGTMIKNMSHIKVKALPQNLPHEIKVAIDTLVAFGDRIAVKDLITPSTVKVLAKPEDAVVSVIAPQDIEAELAKEIEEKVEDVEKIEKEKKEEVIEDAPEAKSAAKPTTEKK